MDITVRLHRVFDGVCRPIPPSEWIAWQTLTHHIVYPWEYDILAAMDVAFCEETDKELDAKRAADADEAERKAKRGRR